MRYVKALFFLFILINFYAKAILLELKDGYIVHGIVINYNDEKVVFKLFKDERIITIPWNELNEISEKKLKHSLGIIEEKKEIKKFFIKGVLIYLKTGSSVKGKFHSQTEDRFIITNKNGLIPIPKTNILKIEKEDVALEEIYKIKELYDKIASNYDLKIAEENIKFAYFLKNLDLYDKTKFHLEEAKKIDPTKSDFVDKELEELENIILKKEIISIEQSYKMYLQTYKYKKAQEMLDKLREKIPEEKFEEYQKKLLETKKVYLTAKIPTLWLKKMKDKVERISWQEKSAIENAKTYVLNKMEEEILKEISEQFEIEENEAKEYFDNREKKQTLVYSYSDGTFIVGIPNQNEKNTKQTIRRTAKNNKLLTADEWWQKITPSKRSEWLKAYYGENRLNVIETRLKDCPYCNGKGLELVGFRYITCSHCQGINKEKSIVCN